MNCSQVEIAGKPAELLLPSGTPRGVCVFLHGYDGVTLKDNAAYHAALEQQQLACLCPLGPHCWWTLEVWPEFDPAISPVEFVGTSVVEFLRERFPDSTESLSIFGVEMGGQGALQVAYRYPRIYGTVVAISPKVDFETWHGHGTTLDAMFPDREAARQRIATLHINPLNWPKRQLLLCDPSDHYCLDGVQTLASKLMSSGVPFEEDLKTTAGGFGWNYANHMADRVVSFLAAGK